MFLSDDALRLPSHVDGTYDVLDPFITLGTTDSMTSGLVSPESKQTVSPASFWGFLAAFTISLESQV